MGADTTTGELEIDRDACDCDREALVVSQVADWMRGNPTTVACDRCGHVFGYTGGYEP